MKRLFWLGVGVAAGVAASRKAGATARRLTPAGFAENLAAAVRELAGAVGAFGAEVRAGMAERETELSAVMRRATGAPASPRALTDAPARARRAGGRDTV